MADSTVTIVGNLTRDPELRYTTTGKAVANLGVAVNRLISRPGEEKRESTSFFNVTAWESLGQNVVDSLGKGARVIVTGRLEQRSWETEEGESRSAVEIVADSIGPDLRWASAEVTKNARNGGDQQVPAASVSGTDEAPF